MIGKYGEQETAVAVLPTDGLTRPRRHSDAKVTRSVGDGPLLRFKREEGRGLDNPPPQ